MAMVTATGREGNGEFCVAVGPAGHRKTYRDTGSTGSHQIGLVMGFRVRDRDRV